MSTAKAPAAPSGRICEKKYSPRFYLLECPVLFGNRTSKNLGVLVRRTIGRANLAQLFKIKLD